MALIHRHIVLKMTFWIQDCYIPNSSLQEIIWTFLLKKQSFPGFTLLLLMSEKISIWNSFLRRKRKDKLAAGLNWILHLQGRFLQRLSRDFSEISIDFSFSKISKILLLIRKTIWSKYNWNQKPYELYFHVQKTLQVTLTTSPGVVHKRI